MTEVRNDIPYIAYESALTRADKANKRLWIVILVLIVSLILTNVGWIIYESQFEVTETTTIEAEQDGSGVNIVGGGDINYGPESKGNQDQNQNQEN